MGDWLKEWNKKVSEAKPGTEEGRRTLYFAAKDYIFVAQLTANESRRQEVLMKARNLVEKYCFHSYFTEEELAMMGLYINREIKSR